MKIAIDGPAGSGKSTVAKLAAKKLGFNYIDTGAYYRWLTYNVLKEKIELKEIAKIIALAKKLDYQNIPDPKIRTREVANNVSAVSALKEIRPYIVEQQRKVASTHNVVMEGRDIGTVVFPDAEVKIFLTASVEERARRRYQEHLDKGEAAELKTIETEIRERDRKDSDREHSPLKKAADAQELDTTRLTIEQVVEKIVEAVMLKGKDRQ